MSNLKDYQSKLNEIKAIPDNETKSPNMPVDRFIQKAENLHHWAQQDKSELTSVGLDWKLVNDIAARAGACREAEAVWNTEKQLQSDAEGLWKEKSPVAYELRDDLLADYRYAFRKDEELVSVVRNIAEGDSHDDMIQDLAELSVLGKKNQKLLKAIRFEEAKLDLAANTANEMAEVLARAVGDRNESSEEKIMRDKAYTYLKLAVDEVIDCGKYVFRNNPERRKGYKSPYSRS